MTLYALFNPVVRVHGPRSIGCIFSLLSGISFKSCCTIHSVLASSTLRGLRCWFSVHIYPGIVSRECYTVRIWSFSSFCIATKLLATNCATLHAALLMCVMNLFLLQITNLVYLDTILGPLCTLQDFLVEVLTKSSLIVVCIFFEYSTSNFNIFGFLILLKTIRIGFNVLLHDLPYFCFLSPISSPKYWA